MSQPTSWQNEDLSDSVSYYLSEVVFKVIVLILTMAVSSHIIHGFGTAKAKKTFMGLFFLSLTIVQYYYIIKASKHIPSNRFYSYKEGLILPSCQESFKGGKASSISNVPENINPCFTHCIGSSYGQCTNGSKAFDYNEPPFFMTSCPLKGFKCNATIGGDEIPRYISSKRDCAGGFGGRCSMAQPCHPCDLAYIREHKVSRCRQCSGSNDGNCRFVEGVGPYCYVALGSKDIEPCKKCCTESTPIIIDGVCY